MELVEKAICFAAQVHDGQIRKMNNIPFILHPCEAAAIVATVTDDCEVCAAAALHDVIEDAGVSEEQIRAEFGDRVTELVLAETEDKMRTLPPDASWRTRKEESLEVLEKTEDLAVLILWLGDKLSNMRSLARDYRKIGDGVFSFFHEKRKSEQAWYYGRIAELLSPLSGCWAYREYKMLFDEVFGDV